MKTKIRDDEQIDLVIAEACKQHTLFDALMYVIKWQNECVVTKTIELVFNGGHDAARACAEDEGHFYRRLVRRVLTEYPVDRQYTDVMDLMAQQDVLEIRDCTVKEGQIDIICPHCSNGDFFPLPVSTGIFNCQGCGKRSVLRDLTL